MCSTIENIIKKAIDAISKNGNLNAMRYNNINKSPRPLLLQSTRLLVDIYTSNELVAWRMDDCLRPRWHARNIYSYPCLHAVVKYPQLEFRYSANSVKVAAESFAPLRPANCFALRNYFIVCQCLPAALWGSWTSRGAYTAPASMAKHCSSE